MADIVIFIMRADTEFFPLVEITSGFAKSAFRVISQFFQRDIPFGNPGFKQVFVNWNRRCDHRK